MINDTRQPRSSDRRLQPQQRDTASSTQFDHIKLSPPLNPDLFCDTAREAAQAVVRADNQRNKSTQLRRFYDELLLWEMRVRQVEEARQSEKFEEFLPFIRMLNAKAAYAEGRKLVDRTFVKLMHHTLAEVKDPQSLTACKLFWEAFMGFYKQERQD